MGVGACAAAYSLLEIELPGRDLTPIGVLLADLEGARTHVRLRRDWDRITEDEEDREVLEALEDDLRRKASDLGAGPFFDYLEDTLSMALRVTDRQAIEVEDFDRALNRLYRENVQSNVIPFRTHLPLYSLRAAAGKFLENEEITEEGWVEMPSEVRLTDQMFLARIAGHSMEPVIPDGALCAFRYNVTGSRQGRLVLVESREATGNNRYTVKRYVSEKARSEEGWVHTRIRLESLNPDYPSWDLDPDQDKYAILAEFVRVLE
jgi:SOS-response transcriptional repressor LexA